MYGCNRSAGPADPGSTDDERYRGHEPSGSPDGSVGRRESLLQDAAGYAGERHPEEQRARRRERSSGGRQRAERSSGRDGRNHRTRLQPTDRDSGRHGGS